MNQLIAIGELLIDFLPLETGKRIKDVSAFKKEAGGAPANVAACVARLGGKSVLISKVGQDPFGDFLIETLDKAGVDTHAVLRTSEANTALAFVTLTESGERDFSFYRNPSADMLLQKDEIDERLFKPGNILHFCSVDLIDMPVKQAHIQAFEYALKHKVQISFDVNLRFSLWNDMDLYRQTVLSFVPYAHLLKMSREEMFFLTGEKTLEASLPLLFVGNVRVIVVTDGEHGADCFTKNRHIHVDSQKVHAIDTTGAGDAFIGALIYKALGSGGNVEDIMNRDIISFAHRVSAYVVSHLGAIPSMPTLADLE